jgi:hypothetical protein
MGEASQRKRRMHARLRAQPWCIYCGGVNEATTIDHMPPITIFDQRRRPRGLEFSACEPCNSGGRVAEKIVGLVTRMYPDLANDAGRQELKRLYREFKSLTSISCRKCFRRTNSFNTRPISLPVRMC